LNALLVTDQSVLPAGSQCQLSTCSSKPSKCSANFDCECLALTNGGGSGMCANPIISCSNLAPCQNNHTCSVLGTVCVNSTKCQQNVCYPVALAIPQMCPPIIYDNIERASAIDYFWLDASVRSDLDLYTFNSSGWVGSSNYVTSWTDKVKNISMSTRTYSTPPGLYVPGVSPSVRFYRGGTTRNTGLDVGSLVGGGDQTSKLRNYTIVIVAKVNAHSRIFSAGNGPYSNVTMCFEINPITGLLSLEDYYAGNSINTTASIIISEAENTKNAAVYSVVVSNSSTSFYYNMVNKSSVPFTSNKGFFGHFNGFALGSVWGWVGRGYNDDFNLYEIRVYKEALKQSQISSLVTALRAKWNI
ncbi:unnamed protein product, partial [Didymodactylos carnosus]